MITNVSDLFIGLFQQYITQSGNALCPWAFQKKSNFYINVRKIAILSGCPFKNSEELVNCLRKKDAVNLVSTGFAVDTLTRFGQLTWAPTDEVNSQDAFLTDTPTNLIEKNEVKDLPCLSGVTTNEGLLLTSGK